MRFPPQRSRLSDGRLHLHDGPIDLIIEAFGEDAAVEAAYAAAWRRFTTILDELCAELPLLRAQATRDSAQPEGVVARCMADAVLPLCDRFITPMAAVAGAVAEEVLNAMIAAAPLSRAYVNNGGDIALHLLADETFHRRHGGSAGPSKLDRECGHYGTRFGARPSDVGLARPQLLAWHRRRCHGARGLGRHS